MGFLLSKWVLNSTNYLNCNPFSNYFSNTMAHLYMRWLYSAEAEMALQCLHQKYRFRQGSRHRGTHMGI
jgi:hypothetical protein